MTAKRDEPMYVVPQWPTERDLYTPFEVATACRGGDPPRSLAGMRRAVCWAKYQGLIAKTNDGAVVRWPRGKPMALYSVRNFDKYRTAADYDVIRDHIVGLPEPSTMSWRGMQPTFSAQQARTRTLVLRAMKGRSAAK